MDWHNIISIPTLNMNGLNIPVKRCGLSEYLIKQEERIKYDELSESLGRALATGISKSYRGLP